MQKHETEIRVRYQETDNMGVVYYANYFTWFEVARTEYLRSKGISYRKLEEKGVYMMVVKATCQYKSPARYDDTVRIETWMPKLKNSSLEFAYNLFVGQRLVATGESVHVFTNRSGRPVRIPEEIRSLHNQRAQNNVISG
ncbi:MAG: acyl-CoA thioesterase [Candidatus Omnitrophica bacterium]|nr:acyl-CoA thioesterase [Candidatus Omnitrophota bacterium]